LAINDVTDLRMIAQRMKETVRIGGDPGRGVDNRVVQSGTGRRCWQNRKQLTNFPKDLILRYAYSKDGKQIAIERGNFESDAFLFRDISK